MIIDNFTTIMRKFVIRINYKQILHHHRSRMFVENLNVFLSMDYSICLLIKIFIFHPLIELLRFKLIDTVFVSLYICKNDTENISLYFHVSSN